MFGTNIRVIVPQSAMSAGTMIALSAKEILMGKHSNLGPIDPQIGGIPAHGVIEEFNRAKDEIQYNPTLIGARQQAIAWSNEMVTAWLSTAMFDGDADGPQKSKKIVDEL